MSIFLTIILAIFLAGVAACIVFDLWQICLQRLVGIPATNWGVIGRWLNIALTKGRLVNDTLDENEDWETIEIQLDQKIANIVKGIGL